MTVQRAKTVDELDEKLGLFTTPEADEHLAQFRVRPSDVIISPDAKCGTTFLQHVAHGIRTGGSLDFEEISCAVPWLITAHDLGIDLNAEQAASPRLFKSHDGAGVVPQGARYIVAFREPIARIVSLYRFLGDWFFDTDAISLDAFAMTRLPSPDNPNGYWHKLVSWWEKRADPDVLVFTYEDMTADVAGTVDRVAAFLGIQLDAGVRERVIHQSSRSFMLEHAERFDEHVLVQWFVDRGLLPPGEDTGKVTPGAGDHPDPSPDVQQAYAAAWAERVTPVTGFADYTALRRALSSGDS